MFDNIQIWWPWGVLSCAGVFLRSSLVQSSQYASACCFVGTCTLPLVLIFWHFRVNYLSLQIDEPIHFDIDEMQFPTTLAAIQPQTITLPPPCFTVCVRFFNFIVVLGFLHTFWSKYVCGILTHRKKIRKCSSLSRRFFRKSSRNFQFFPKSVACALVHGYDDGAAHFGLFVASHNFFLYFFYFLRDFRFVDLLRKLIGISLFQPYWNFQLFGQEIQKHETLLSL